MRFVGLLLGFFGLAAPAWADACGEALTRAIADKDARRIEAFFDRRAEDTRAIILTWRERLELDFAAVVVLKRQLKAIEEVEQGSTAMGVANATVFAALKARLKHRIELFEKEARFDVEALEKFVADSCVEFSKREAAAREPRGQPGQPGQPGTQTEDRRPPKVRYGTSAVLVMDGQPKPQQKFGGFKIVEAGKIYVEDPNYKITGEWTELPQSLEPQGKSIKLTITVWAKSDVNSGIQIRGGNLVIERSFLTAKTKEEQEQEKKEWGSEPLDLPASAKGGKEVIKSMIVHIKPSPLYDKNAKAWISVGIFYGLKVDYLYKVENTGEN